MTRKEIYEEVRALLREPQIESVEDPYTYTDDELDVQLRSALRNLRSLGLPLRTQLLEEGVLAPQPSESQGVLLSLYIASGLLSGDLTQKLRDGDLGVYFRVGSDVIDMKTATTNFRQVSEKYRDRFEVLLTIALTDTVNASGSVFGGQGTSFDA